MGHHVGDQAIYTAALCIRAVFDAVGYCQMLQNNRQLTFIAGNLEKKIKNELLDLLKNDRQTYEKFYGIFL